MSSYIFSPKFGRSLHAPALPTFSSYLHWLKAGRCSLLTRASLDVLLANPPRVRINRQLKGA
jgi:hypothetical protein